MNPVETIPLDGTRVLVLTPCFQYCGWAVAYRRKGQRIVEARFHKGRWTEWTGVLNGFSTSHVMPLGWWPKPETPDPKDD